MLQKTASRDPRSYPSLVAQTESGTAQAVVVAAAAAAVVVVVAAAAVAVVVAAAVSC